VTGLASVTPREQFVDPGDLDSAMRPRMSVSQACGSMEIVLSLNLTPRKCIGYLTPIQAFFKGLGKDIQIRIA
jgi:hypothetical protein